MPYVVPQSTFRRPFSKPLAQCAPELSDLLERAAGALADEDALLNAALAAGPAPAAYDELNHGLAYPVADTTLAYQIFKAWLPVVPAAWDHPYPKSQQRADLVVFHDAGRAPRWVFEARWWQFNQLKVERALDRDVDKLRNGWPRAETYLMTFWASQMGSLPDDMAQVERYCARRRGVEPIHLSAFPTHVHRWRRFGAYLAVATLAVTKA